MAHIRYRAIIKVLCGECQAKVNENKRIDVKCPNCSFKKYQNVNNLLSFNSFITKAFPNWIWFNIYEYKKGELGALLKSFQRGKNEPTAKTL
ncbi:hypothetical protein SAMN04487911_13038 [Arenibacter nanhaiticus]|uniref:Uncharacterized protein n=1 Tax=Arenibacter nanhaiticus TaxID=558155 RepID=A0A1M6LAF2_9FLAO|nr:hypothetical protein [Arenibacter nanhaiticus]SHJ68134.1 hypothetical protein SAMN04487911_13038 [Arenibacter nanhaiticus]